MPFFQKVRFVFQISQSPKIIIPKNYPELEIWKKMFTDMCGNFQFQAQDSFFRIFFWEIGRFEKGISLSEKKALLSARLTKLRRDKFKKHQKTIDRRHWWYFLNFSESDSSRTWCKHSNKQNSAHNSDAVWLPRDFLIDGWCIGIFFLKLSKSWNNLNSFHLHIGKMNKNYDRK